MTQPNSKTQPPTEGTASTKTQLLDAAETLFEKNGIRGTSLRAITELAKANIASVNYHFGSKRELIQAVLARRLDPLNQERLVLLDQLEQQSDFNIEQVFTALIAPAIRHPERYPGLRLVARIQFEPDPSIAELVHQPFVEVQARFLAALRTAAPSLSDSTLIWRLTFAVGAMAATVINLDHLRSGSAVTQNLPRGAKQARIAAKNHDAVIAQLVRFIAGGMLADEVSLDQLKNVEQHKATDATKPQTNAEAEHKQ